MSKKKKVSKPEKAISLVQKSGLNPTVNFIYALVGAINGGHLKDVIKHIKLENFFK